MINSIGRSSKPDFFCRCITIILLFFCPLSVLFFLYNVCPSGTTFIYDSTVMITLLQWIFLQLILYLLPDFFHKIVPKYKGGKIIGKNTPAGHRLSYNINGLQSYIISIIIFFYFGYDKFLVDNYGKCFVAANIIGILVAILSYVKASLFPSYLDDNIVTGHFFYDFFMGIELNPRLFDIDIKLFFNGRPGIIAWTIINFSFTLKFYNEHHFLSSSLIVLNLLQILYVVDFFWNESWYLETIDIIHDHFGFYLAWGDCVWLPFMYTLQAVYLSQSVGNSSILVNLFILILGIASYCVFRISNNQKRDFRNGNEIIWGKKAKYITCKYLMYNNVWAENKLLCSGFWAWSRHMNYLADIFLSCAMCLSCGFDSIYPYFYCINMILLLVCRCYRDEDKCKRKYGEKWDEYCKIVPNRIIPYWKLWSW